MKTLPALHGTFSFTRDERGYPSIEATDFVDGTYALGYLHATDRLTQVTLSTLAAQGRLMSVLGDRELPRLVDYSVRTLGIGRGLSEQVAACGARGREYLDAYCAGFNEGAKGRRPLVLRLLGVEPEPLTPELLVAVFRTVTYFGLTSMQVSSELIIAELCSRGAPERLIRTLLGPLADGIDWADVRKVAFPSALSFFDENFGASTMAGSNAFAASKERSATGGALLMGEFHMEINRWPPLLYAAHIETMDGTLTGVTIPGLAWFAAGRTSHVGWSYTFAHADNIDFALERVKAGTYLRNGEWRPLTRRDETVTIKGKEPETWTYHDTEYGTVVGEVGEEEVVRPCMRMTGLDQTFAALDAAPRIFDCLNIDDLAEVLRTVKNVSLEAIMVDSSGAIGSIVTGQVDQRPDGWTGMYPRRAWDLPDGAPAPLDESTRPTLLRPASGTLTSANQGGHGPHLPKWCSLPEPLYRFQRIEALLAAKEKHDFASLTAISYDVFDLSAARLLPIWADLLPDHPRARALILWARTQHDPGPANARHVTLYTALYEECVFELLGRDLDDKTTARFREWSALSFYRNALDAALALERPDVLDREELRALLGRAFSRALTPSPTRREMPVKMRLEGVLTQGKTPAFLGFDSPVVELPGTPVTPFQCSVSPIGGKDSVYGPSFHLLIDMSKPGARYNLPGGASESRFGPGFGQGYRAWLTGDTFPIGR